MAMEDGATTEAQTQHINDGSHAQLSRRRWVCSQCDHAFKKREHLVRHVRSHTKEKPFACDFCLKCYGRRDSLIRHTRTHGRLGRDSLTSKSNMQVPRDEVAAEGQPSPAHALPIHSDSLSWDISMDERASFEDPNESMAGGLTLSDQWTAPAATIGMYSSTGTQGDFLNIEEVFDNLEDWSDPNFLIFQDVMQQPSRLVEESNDVNALASCLPASGLPRDQLSAPTVSTQEETHEHSNGGDATENADNNIRRLIRDQWYKRPEAEAAYPYPPTAPLNRQDQVDEAYRAGLSYRLHSKPRDEVLPSADFLNPCTKLYFAKFQPILPIIHVPSFRPSSENALLLLSICSIGALFIGTANAAARGRKIFAKLNKAVLASWEVYLYRGGHEALAVAQAVALGQTFGMLSKNSNDLLMTDSFHGTIISWARQTGMFQVNTSFPLTDPASTNELEKAWISWSRAEETIRFLLALHIHDYQFAAIFHHGPILRHESGSLPRCSPDELFIASTAAQWHAKLKSLRSCSSFDEAQYVESRNWPVAPKFEASLNGYTVLAGIGATICEARYKIKNEEQIADFRYRLMSWYEIYSSDICHPRDDPHCLMVLWHEIFMLLYVSFDWIEGVIGCDGTLMTPDDLACTQTWVAGLQGQRCAIHAMHIYKCLKELPISTEPAIHVPKALFYAGLVIYFHAKFRSSESPHVEVYVPELQCGNFRPTISLDQLDSSTLYSLVDLLRRQGHWKLSHKFASVLEILMDDLICS